MKEKLINYIQSEILGGKQTVGEDQNLLISGLVDSISVMRIVSFVESESGKSVPAKDVTLENFCDVNSICNYVETL